MQNFTGRSLLSKLFPSREASTDVSVVEDEPKINPFPHGPVRYRHGSQSAAAWHRRQLALRDKRESRKANRRYRKAWMDNQRAVAVLRGQLVTVAAIKTEDGRYLVGQSGALMKNAHEQLERVYGSVDAATAHYETILADRA